MNCVFCDIVAGKAPASFVGNWPDAVAFKPLQPVTEGHILVIPKKHVRDFTEIPYITGIAARCAAMYAQDQSHSDFNLITSAGKVATQSVFHLHFHVVPRRAGDGLKLPWSGQHFR